MAALLVGPAAARACPDPDVLPAGITAARFNAATLCLVNQERASRGLGILTESPALDAAALGHSQEMLRYGFFAHDSHDGSPFQNRIFATGYVDGAESWELAENLAWGEQILGTPRAITDAWMQSPHHRDTILNPDLREVGSGAVFGSPLNPTDARAVTVTHDFGVVERDASAASGAKTKRHRRAKALKRKRHRLRKAPPR